MALQFTFLRAFPNLLIYDAQADGGQSPGVVESGTIQSTGAGDADVALEDAVVAGPLKEIIDAVITTQDQARNLLLSRGGGDPVLSNVASAICMVIGTQVSSGQIPWGVDAQVNNGGPALLIEGPSDDSVSAMVYIKFLHTIPNG